MATKPAPLPMAAVTFDPGFDAEMEAIQQADAAAIAQAQSAPRGAGAPAGTRPITDTRGLPPDLAGADVAYRWLVAWLVTILLLILAARTRIGYTIIYYLLALSLLFLLVTNYQWIAAALTPFDSKASLAQ